jgi:hypothetical protein
MSLECRDFRRTRRLRRRLICSPSSFCAANWQTLGVSRQPNDHTGLFTLGNLCGTTARQIAAEMIKRGNIPKHSGLVGVRLS